MPYMASLIMKKLFDFIKNSLGELLGFACFIIFLIIVFGGLGYILKFALWLFSSVINTISNND
jgi:hypothetical protein